jgi:hypothetical protein
VGQSFNTKLILPRDKVGSPFERLTKAIRDTVSRLPSPVSRFPFGKEYHQRSMEDRSSCKGWARKGIGKANWSRSTGVGGRRRQGVAQSVTWSQIPGYRRSPSELDRYQPFLKRVRLEWDFPERIGLSPRRGNGISQHAGAFTR